MIKELIKINRNLFYATERQLKSMKHSGAININELNIKEEKLSEKQLIENISLLSNILKSPDLGYIFIKYRK